MSVHAYEDRPYATADINQNLTTYHHLLIAARYVVLAHIVVGSFLVLTFCTSAGFIGGAFVALVELVCGLALARERQKPNWMSEMSNLFISTSEESGAPEEF